MLHAAILAVALGSATVAQHDSRCNAVNINTIQDQLQGFAQRPASGAQRKQRAVDIVQAQSDIEEESVVLQGICPQDDFPPLSARLYALDAWADLLEQRNGAMGGGASCPDADRKVIAATAASAWLRLGRASLVAAKPPALVATLVPQVRALAVQAGMTLPAFADATAYWEQQYVTAAKQAIVDCAAQTPHP
jgi:hypothetical protein